MASAMRKTASSAAKVLLRQNAKQVTLASTKNVMSQAKVADRSDSSQSCGRADQSGNIQDHGRYTETPPKLEAVQVHIRNTGDKLHINLENVPTAVQKDLIDNLGLFMNNCKESDHIPSVSYNFISEDVYRDKLYMPFHKLGYDCVFSRYNNDKGLASFKLEGANDQIRYSYFRSALPNKT